MSYKFIGLLKCSLIQEKINPLPSRKLPRLMLSLPPLRTATLLGNRMPRGKLRKVALMTVGLRFGNGLRNRTLSNSHRT